MNDVIRGKPRDRRGIALGLIRIFIGIWFLWSGIPKLNSAYFNEQMGMMLQYFADQGSVGFYQEFLRWAAEHAKVFAYLTAIGEVAVGVLLILGFLTPLALGSMMFLCFNYLLATKNLGPAPIGINFLCLTIGVALFFGKAGKSLGLDGLLFKERDL